MKPLLVDMCVDRRHAAPAFLSVAEGAFVTDWLSSTALDFEVLELARKLDRILVTEDADFGDLIFRDRLAPPPGVIFVVTQRIPKEERARRLAHLAPSALAVVEGHFVVVGPTRNRFRPFPGVGAP